MKEVDVSSINQKLKNLEKYIKKNNKIGFLLDCILIPLKNDVFGQVVI